MQIAAISAGIFCLACWGLTVWELQNTSDLSTSVANKTADNVAITNLEPTAINENNRLAVFAEKPLFRPDRRPLDWRLINRSNAAEQQKTLTDIEKRYQLKGVSITTPEQAALIFDTETSETLTLNLNESLSGWRLQLVDKHSITMSRQARKLQLFLSPPDITPEITTGNELTVQPPKPVKAISSVPDDDPYQ